MLFLNLILKLVGVMILLETFGTPGVRSFKFPPAKYSTKLFFLHHRKKGLFFYKYLNGPLACTSGKCSHI